MQKLEWEQSNSEGCTHFVSDGQEGYYTCAEGKSLREVAEAFASGYEHGDDVDSYVVAKVTTWDDATETRGDAEYFAFDGHGKFEWDTEREYTTA